MKTAQQRQICTRSSVIRQAFILNDASALLSPARRAHADQQIGHADAEASGNPLQGGQGDVFFTALDRGVVGAVHVDVVGKAFLAELASGSLDADRVTCLDGEFCFFHPAMLWPALLSSLRLYEWSAYR